MKMSVEQAYKILAVPRSADIKAIKKKYRKLMLKVHPDSLKSGKNTYQYSAQEINEAYSIIIKYLSDNKMSGYFNNSSDDSYSSEYTYDEEYYQDYNSYASDAVIGDHLLMIMRIQAVIYIIMQKVQEEILLEALL